MPFLTIVAALAGLNATDERLPGSRISRAAAERVSLYVVEGRFSELGPSFPHEHGDKGGRTYPRAMMRVTRTLKAGRNREPFPENFHEQVCVNVAADEVSPSESDLYILYVVQAHKIHEIRKIARWPRDFLPGGELTEAERKARFVVEARFLDLGPQEPGPDGVRRYPTVAIAPSRTLKGGQGFEKETRHVAMRLAGDDVPPVSGEDYILSIGDEGGTFSIIKIAPVPKR